MWEHWPVFMVLVHGKDSKLDPINYNIDVKSPFDSAIQGVQTGFGIGQAALQSQQLQLQQAQQRQMQADLMNLSQNKNPTAQDYAAMMTKYPTMADHFQKSWNVLNADQQQNTLSDATQTYAALQSGNPDIALSNLNNKIAAYKNSGQIDQANKLSALAHVITMNPDAAKTSTALMLSSVMGPDKFASTFGTLGDQTRANELQPSKVAQSQAEATIQGVAAGNAPTKTALDNANLQSQIDNRAAQLGLDKDKLTSDVQMKLLEMNNNNNKLDDAAKKNINDFTTQAVASDQSAANMLDLANRLEQSGATSGAAAKGTELYKSLTGNQDAITQLRQEYVRLRSTQSMKLLPPGSASDKDVENAMKGFPDENTNPNTMASFIRGMAKLSQYDSILNTAKSEWVNSVGHLGKPKNDLNIEGVAVPAGSTFTDFSKQFLKSKVDQRAQEQNQAQLQGRSYMRFANPDTVQAPVAPQPAVASQAQPQQFAVPPIDQTGAQ